MGAAGEDFQSESARIRIFLNKYTETFKRSNQDIRVVWITYRANKFLEQITKDSTLNLGPDLIITQQFTSPELLERNLTTTLPNQQYFDSIYSPRIQAEAKTKNKYTFAPWLIDTQVACFNTTKINNSPKTIEALEELSASGKKIGLSLDPYQLIWTAGTQGAIPEISSLSTKTTHKQQYKAIENWLQWLHKAALYQNISFHEGYRELIKKLKNNELDWVTCWGSELEELKKTMGNSLGVSALPNGSTSKAFPTNLIFGFALGENSSHNQRKMAMKFIKTDVNNIAQRKLQLDDVGFLAANKNTSIRPESSKILTALNTSFNVQNKHYKDAWPGIEQWLLPEEKDFNKRLEHYGQLGRTFRDLANGYLSTKEALTAITTTPTK